MENLLQLHDKLPPCPLSANTQNKPGLAMRIDTCTFDVVFISIVYSLPLVAGVTEYIF